MSMEEYLKQIGGTEPFIEKAQSVKEVAQALCPETIEDFVVSEYTKKDGSRFYESLWFFSCKYVLESKNIISEEYNVDIACIYRDIDRYEITYSNFDPRRPETTTEDSRIKVEGNTPTVKFLLRASKGNCSKLWSVFEKYLKPHLSELMESE